ncbi:hypothetical protein ACFVHI_04235 [Kitasatospora sp. NPDC127121]|uniref:hypothetical protein n=1 Tax=Kitasatospora sp. NPDC127121 TaxID=3345371 RepID=UPI00363369E6
MTAGNLANAEIFTLSHISTISQIAFWTSTSVVATLSYRNAKRTIFQPIKTEIFKKQVDVLADTLNLLNGDRQSIHPGGFDFTELLTANVAKLYDAYLSYAFDMKRPMEVREYRVELCPSSLIAQEALELDTSDKITPGPLGKPSKPPSWTYRHLDLSLPLKYSDRVSDFRELLKNPLLPSHIASLLSDFLDAVTKKTVGLGPVIEAAAKEMPERYPTLDDLTNASFSWVDNRYNRETDSLAPLADQLTGEIRAYFAPDSIMATPKRSFRRKGRRLEATD